MTLRKNDAETLKNRTGKALEKARKIAQGEITPPKLRKPRRLFKRIERNKSFSKRSSDVNKKSGSSKKDSHLTSATNSEVIFAAKHVDQQAQRPVKTLQSIETYRLGWFK